MGILVDARMVFAEANAARYEVLWRKLIEGEITLDRNFDEVLAREPGLADFLREKIKAGWAMVNEAKRRQMFAEDDGA